MVRARLGLNGRLNGIAKSYEDVHVTRGVALQFIPTTGKWQIIGAIGAIESIAEAQKPHPMRGGVPGKIDFLWDPAGTMDSLSADQLKTKVRSLFFFIRFLFRSLPCW
jgi:hypothetical protein